MKTEKRWKKWYSVLFYILYELRYGVPTGWNYIAEMGELTAYIQTRICCLVSIPLLVVFNGENYVTVSDA